MIGPLKGVRIYLAGGPTDMRKGFDGLARLVQEVLRQDPCSGALFAFRGKRGDRVKLLWWDGQGFCLFYKRPVEGYRDSAPMLAAWLEAAIPEGLAVFSLPERHGKRTSNPMERSIQQEIKRRTVKVRVFPNETSLERLVTAILVEIDDKWAATDKAYITWKAEDD